jgi:hypothetical protein
VRPAYPNFYIPLFLPDSGWNRAVAELRAARAAQPRPELDWSSKLVLLELEAEVEDAKETIQLATDAEAKAACRQDYLAARRRLLDARLMAARTLRRGW